MKILITGGGSEEKIDNVRSITNFSTGKTSSYLADYFAECNCKVTAIMAEKAVKPQTETRILTYRTFSELKELLETECKTGSYDAVIHAAAVSDYSPEKVIVDGKEFLCGEISKLPAGSEVTIKLKKNPKLLDSLKLWSGNKTRIIGFKLTSNASTEEREAAVQKIFSSNKDLSFSPDFVVSNDLSEMTNQLHPCTIYSKDMKIASKANNLQELAQEILKLIWEEK